MVQPWSVKPKGSSPIVSSKITCSGVVKLESFLAVNQKLGVQIPSPEPKGEKMSENYGYQSLKQCPRCYSTHIEKKNGKICICR